MAEPQNWADMSVALEQEEEDPRAQETTPLTTPQQSPERRDGVTRRRSSDHHHRQMTTTQHGEEVTAYAAKAALEARVGKDMRGSRLSYALLSLLTLTFFLDILLLVDVGGSLSLEATSGLSQFGTDTRSIARVVQLLAIIITLALGAYSMTIHRRWQVSSPRHAAAAAMQLTLLPEYTAIAIVLDVGKLAYPAGARVALVSLLMLVRVTTIAALLRLSFIVGVRRGITSMRRMPEMLRTLVSLEGVEARGLGDLAPQAERPLTVALLEKLIVFLTPKRLGEKTKEGAGLARNSAMPLTTFALCLTGLAAYTEYDRLQTSQEPGFEVDVALMMKGRSLNETDRLGWRAPASQPMSPVSTFFLIVSGMNTPVGSKIMGQAFDVSVNPLCALDGQTECKTHALRSVVPSRSLPNWIAALTGASPTTTGVLGNFGVGPFPFDSVFARARAFGMHTGVSASPWLVNPVKVDLPLLEGDGRTTSSANGVYETTYSATTEHADARRKAATLEAVTSNAASLEDSLRTSHYPSRFPLFVSQLTNVDSVGHRRGASTREYEEAMTDAATFVMELMSAMPANSVLLVASDHGHEELGGAGGTSEAVSKTPMFTYRKSVSFGASAAELDVLTDAAGLSSGARASSLSSGSRRRTRRRLHGQGGEVGRQEAAAEDGGRPRRLSEAGGGGTAAEVAAEQPVSELSMLDLAPTLCLLAGLPVPRHTEGGFFPPMFANARRELWPLHAQDLLYQRYHYAKALLAAETLDEEGRLRPLEELELDASASIAAGGGTPLEQTVVWLTAAGEVNDGIMDARRALRTRYAMRNLAVSTALGLLLLLLFLYVLQVMSFADPVFVLTFRRHALMRHRSFWSLPDVIAIQWAAAIVAAYYFISITTYLTLVMGRARYSAFDASHVHDTFSQRRYLLATLFPGLIAQWGLTRAFTIYYMKPFVPPPAQPSLLLTALRYLVKLRLIFSGQVESRAVAKVYLIRLYLATFTVLVVVLIFVASSAASFPLPYMYQPTHIDVHTWDSRFQTLTYKIISLPLLFGAVYNLHLWRGTRLTVAELEAVYRLKRRKEARMMGTEDELEEEEKREREEDAMLRQLVRKKQSGELSVEGLQDIEALLRRTSTQSTLLTQKLEEQRRRIERQMLQRSEAVHAVKSSKAFLGRGFRDIEMLLEAGFRELEDQRSNFMANRRKKLRQRIERDRARRAQRSAGYRGGGGLAFDASRTSAYDGGGGAAAAEKDEDESSGDSDDESLASFDSDALGSMDFDELQARLAANEAKDRRDGVGQMAGGEHGDGGDGGEGQAADIRRTEFHSLAQSKMGKQAQLEELTARVEKERLVAADVKERLEAAMADEQAHLQEWEKADARLQEAEVERATVVGQKTKAKELALEKAQVAESSLEELKEKYRDLRRREERILRAVREAEAEGGQQARDLELQAENLRRERATWTERIEAAEEDRKVLFGEAQRVEAQMRDQNSRKVEAQASAVHYRDLLKTQM